jgi:nucleotide-binding universal stress UspA family protein
MERIPTRILLATDGSECADTAGRVAVDLANRSGAELDVVHAFEFVPPREYAGVALRLRSPGEFTKQGQRVLDEQVGRIREMGGEVADARLCVGSPADQILCRAEASDADLIVVGRRGLGGVKRLLMGSVSEGVVQHARCPVLVVCGDGEVWPPARVVISDDTSEDARKAGELAAGIGGLFGAEGVLVQVYPRVLKSTQGMSALESKIVDHALREAESELANRAEELAPLLGSVPEVKLVVDEAEAGVDGVAPTILEEAAGAGVPSLISVGRRGLGAVQRARVGSVSTKVIRAARGPVLVYPHASAGMEEANGG